HTNIPPPQSTPTPDDAGKPGRGASERTTAPGAGMRGVGCHAHARPWAWHPSIPLQIILLRSAIGNRRTPSPVRPERPRLLFPLNQDVVAIDAQAGPRLLPAVAPDDGQLVDPVG